MVENSAAFLCLQMLLSTTFRFLAGDRVSATAATIGSISIRPTTNPAIGSTRTASPDIRSTRKLKQQRSILNDIQIYVAAATRALEKRLSLPQEDQRPDRTNRLRQDAYIQIHRTR